MINKYCISARSCFEAFTENMTGEIQLLELRRLYHCAAYNCAIAAISCSFSEPKFFHGFLFSEKPEKVLSGFYKDIKSFHPLDWDIASNLVRLF